MERHRPARRLTKARYLILAVIAGLLAATAACGDSDQTAPTAPASTPIVAPTAIPDNAAPASKPGPTPSVAASTSPTTSPVETPDAGLVVGIDELRFPVDLAINSDDRIKGLSGRESLDSGTGMLFIFEKAERFRFWMREMLIPLDIVWISSECRVVDVSENVPFPDPETPLNDLPRYSPESRALYVLEINGGEAAERGLAIGGQVRFLDALAGQYRC